MRKLIVLFAIVMTLLLLMTVKAPKVSSAEKLVDAQVTDTYILIGKRLRTRVA